MSDIATIASSCYCPISDTIPVIMSNTISHVKLQRKTFEDNAAFFLLLKAATEIVTSGEKLLRNADATLTIKDFDVLAYVGVLGPIRPRDLLKRSVLVGNPQTLSSVLDRLEKGDLVSRQPIEDDSRGIEVSVTDQGLEQLNAIFPLLSKKLIEPFNLHYTHEELTELRQLLDRL
jgi:DNA-binding MarR family transcriptional regulator